MYKLSFLRPPKKEFLKIPLAIKKKKKNPILRTSGGANEGGGRDIRGVK